ncbi:glycosyltransferase family 87 protein [Granulicella tundricola]|uniref:WD40-like beta Propeller containing protein n=1 Tax=Granulicella tundricola (strain ATCC BAA-1859 / DSM 23138 / MP5ACTX9) TaxID=1198114 RepID=E8WYQ3_GRATM|nr:glycosyltransferase family 87 protein [Granulicella tundricola]ADW67651.1 WD40-like beta Propeller containing protein [Granulicella tundricola MP5ACTX9]
MTDSRQGILAAAEWLLLVVFTCVLAVHTLPQAWRTLNTDFPNYYLTARLNHEGYDLSQAYDWRWFQREKDHHGIDQRLVGFAPITPFSTLFVWPLTSLAPLPAKHVWLLLQLALLVPISLLLRSLTAQPMRRILLLAAGSYPLHRNLLYGQFYILLLGILVLACWTYRRRMSAWAGALIAIAAMTKVFPVIFLLYFIRKRDWRALGAALTTLCVCGLLSVSIFGWSIHRTYLQTVLPWTLRGETLPPYILTGSSLSALLHRLFVYEPQWNPHPWHNAPMAASILGTVLQMLLVAAALLAIRSGGEQDVASRSHAPLEWSALLCVTLATSTSPASYNFILLLLPVLALCAMTQKRRPQIALAAVALYFAIGYPNWNTSDTSGLHAVLHVPRLWLLILFSLICCRAAAGISLRARLWHRSNIPWASALVLLALAGVVSGIRHQRGLYDDYAFRLPMRPDVFLAADPLDDAGRVKSVSMLPAGYRVLEDGVRDSVGTPGTDQLSFAINRGADWLEEAGLRSRLISQHGPLPGTIDQARSPFVPADGQGLAYVRDDHGRGRVYLHLSTYEKPLTPLWMSVLEGASAKDGIMAVAATQGEEASQIFLLQPGGVPSPSGLGEARYPAFSPDGHWLAYSRLVNGAWNLWLLDRHTQRAHPLTEAPCDQVEASWEPDSKTLLYASDCGRALGFTAICRRRIVP